MPNGNGAAKVASRGEFLAALKKHLAREKVDLPELGLSVLVWELTASERIEYQESLTTAKHRVAIGRKGRTSELEIESHAARGLLKLCVMALKDEDGNRQYTEEDLRWMGARVLNRLFAVAVRLSGLDEEAEDGAGKDSSPTATDVGSLNSPSLPEGDPSASS